MTRSRMYSREIVNEVQLVYLNVYNFPVRQGKLTLENATKRAGTILDYSLAGMKIKTSALLFPGQRVDIELQGKQKLIIHAEIVGLRRRSGRQFEYGTKFIMDQNSFFEKTKFNLHPIRQFHSYRERSLYGAQLN